VLFQGLIRRSELQGSEQCRLSGKKKGENPVGEASSHHLSFLIRGGHGPGMKIDEESPLATSFLRDIADKDIFRPKTTVSG